MNKNCKKYFDKLLFSDAKKRKPSPRFRAPQKLKIFVGDTRSGSIVFHPVSKLRRTQWIPTFVGMTILFFYCAKLLFSEVFIAGQWGTYCYENYFLINVFAIVMDSGVISEPLIMRATSFTRSSPVISQTDVVVLSLVTDLDILK